ncbi:hypothetical protein HOY82DRAFT_120441 [Tuber indicum]|nr:hypothetical protein HOY82DRAFT_120441 [Tuber indicum]
MRFSVLPTLLIVTSVSAVSLSDISPLPSNSVTPGCESAYGEPIPACPSDLRASKQCSAGCSAALDETAKKVIVACRQAFIGPDTLLRRVLDGGIQKTLCGAAVSTPVYLASSTGSDSVPGAKTTTITASPTSTSTSASTLTKSTVPTRAPSFSGSMTLSIERPTGSSSLAGLLTLDNSPAPTGSFETADSSFTRIFYNPNSTSTAESASIAAASTTSNGMSGNGSPFTSGEINSAPPSFNSQKGAWVVFALLAAFLSL